MLLSLLSLTLAGRYLERVWGQAELLKFVAVVIGASNAIAVLVNYVESALLSRGKERFLYVALACFFFPESQPIHLDFFVLASADADDLRLALQPCNMI